MNKLIKLKVEIEESDSVRVALRKIRERKESAIGWQDAAEMGEQTRTFAEESLRAMAEDWMKLARKEVAEGRSLKTVVRHLKRAAEIDQLLETNWILVDVKRLSSHL